MKKSEKLLEDVQLEAGSPDRMTDWKPVRGLRFGKRRLFQILTTVARRTVLPLLPRFPSSVEKPRRAAYLDGLRGFAAFIVYWHHHELWAHKSTGQNHLLENSFGYEGNHHLAAFPFIRNFFNGGHYAVATFFVISGYALASKPLSMVQVGDLTKLGDNVASALFRRWFRLWVPLMVVTFIYISSWHLFGIWVEDTTAQGTWHEEVWAWYAEMKNFNFVYGGDRQWLSYDMHLWSIPVEMKGSIIIYTVLTALSRSTRNARLWCELALIYYFIYIADGWYGGMFVSGMLLCDLDLLSEKGELPNILQRLRPAKSFIFAHLLVFSIYLGGVPECDSSDVANLRIQRGWYYLSLLKPQAVFDYKWFYLLWASTALVGTVSRFKWLKGFFETRFCQYLGRISYALYLVHGPILWTLGDRIYTAVGWHGAEQLKNLAGWVDRAPLPKAGPLGLEVAFLLPQVVLLPVTIWVAEIVTRLVDEPSVRFAQWLYRRTLPGVPDRTVIIR